MMYPSTDHSNTPTKTNQRLDIMKIDMQGY